MASKLHVATRGNLSGYGQLAPSRLAEIRLITFQKENPMKKIVLVAVMAGSLVSGQAMAACTAATRLAGPAIITLLAGNTVCVPTATILTMTWQELHSGTSGGPLIDYKRGPSHPVDPSETVGTWTVNGTEQGNSSVTHAYSGGGGTYTYTVHSTTVSDIYSFCVGATEIVARVKSGGGAC